MLQKRECRLSLQANRQWHKHFIGIYHLHGTEAWIQGLPLARQVPFELLCQPSVFCFIFLAVVGLNSGPSTQPLETHPSTFCFSYFSDIILYFYTRPTSDSGLPTYAYCIAGITDICHYALADCLLTFGSH
jgi:hypothetical protein